VFHFFMVLRLHSICWSVDRVWICMGTAEPAKEGQRTSHGHTHILDTAKETTGRNTWRGISLQFGLATAHNMAHMWDDPHCLDWPRDHVSSYQAICYTIRTYVLLLAGTPRSKTPSHCLAWLTGSHSFVSVATIQCM
jgi:hypothetical protein